MNKTFFTRLILSVLCLSAATTQAQQTFKITGGGCFPGTITLNASGTLNGKTYYVSTTTHSVIGGWGPTNNTTVECYWQSNRWNIGIPSQRSSPLYTINSTSATPPTSPASWVNWECGGNLTSIVLPIELTSFSASAGQGKNQLHWATASEKDNRGFEVERSFNGADFVPIAFVKGAGTTSTRQQYVYTDATASANLAYYRLKQVDTDGNFEYSKVVSVEGDVRGIVRVLPTWVQDVVNIEGAENYAIFNTAGQMVLQSIENQLNVHHLPTGVYFVRGRDAQGANFSTKFLKQ